MLQELTNEQKAQLLLQGCLYKEQGHDEAVRRLVKEKDGMYAYWVDPILGEWKDCRVFPPHPDVPVLTIKLHGHGYSFLKEIPLESIEIIN